MAGELAPTIRWTRTWRGYPQAIPMLQRVVEKAATDAQGQVQMAIQQMGAVDTGNMMGSVHVEPGAHELERVVVSPAEYSVYVEMGTIYMAGRPFFHTGMDRVREGFSRAVDAVVNP